MTRTLREIAEVVQGRVIGDDSIELSGVSAVHAAKAGELVFVEEEEHLASALKSMASAVIAGEFAAALSFAKPVLICAQPRLAFARAARLLRDPARYRARVHPSAILHGSVRLGEEVSIGERAVLRAGVVIHQNTRIGVNCVVGEGVTMGRDCEIYPNVTIYPGTRIGDRVVVHAGAVLGSDGFGYVRDKTTGSYEQFPQIGKLFIEDDVEIGANTTIDRGALEETRIGRGTKIDNLVHVGHNVKIGEDVVIAAQTGISGSTVIENNVVIAGQVGLGDHARVEAGVILGGQCGILPHKVVRGKGMVFWGTPARPLREYLKQLAVLARLAR